MKNSKTYTAFAGHGKIASGDLHTTLLATKAHIDRGGSEPVLVFDDETGKQIDFNFQGTPEEVLAHLASHPLFAGEADTAAATRTGPGRPKLGVVCREVSLLPRHWEWLDEQPGSVSVTLRGLVEEARKSGRGQTPGALVRAAAGKFMWNIAGNLAGFEEASRFLCAGDTERFNAIISAWPEDIRLHLQHLVEKAADLDSRAPCK